MNLSHRFSAFNLFAGGFLTATVILFLIWGLGFTHYHAPYLFILSALFGLFMAFNIGGNDVANSFGTSVGAGTLSVPQALAIAAIFEVSGALIAGGEVTDTIRKGIVDLEQLDIQPLQLVYIMMSSLIAAALWLLFATHKGWPVSTTHSIVGAIVGAALVMGTVLDQPQPLNMVRWRQIGHIVLSWVISPVLGGLMSYLVFRLIKEKILLLGEIEHEKYAQRVNTRRLTQKAGEESPEPEALPPEPEPAPPAPEAYSLRQNWQLLPTEPEPEPAPPPQPWHKKLSKTLGQLGQSMQGVEEQKLEEEAYPRVRRVRKVYLPLIAAAGVLIVGYMLIFKGLKNLALDLSSGQYLTIFAVLGLLSWFITKRFTGRFRSHQLARITYIFFSWMQVLTASCFAFSHGSNDIANAIGPFAAILEVLKRQTLVLDAPIPFYAMLAFGIALVAGLWFIGKEVIATVGTHLAAMSPASGFTAELSAAIVVLLASSLGLPVSSTHILVGAVLGIGLVNRNANWRLMKPIALAWIITVPIASIIAALSCALLLRF